MQLIKKFRAFHGTRRFVTALTSVRHLSLSWASPIQSIYTHPSPWRSILILSAHLRLGLTSGSFPPVSPPRPYTPPSPHPYAPHAQPISFFSILPPAQYWVRSTYHLAPRYAISSIPLLPQDKIYNRTYLPPCYSCILIESLHMAVSGRNMYRAVYKILFHNTFIDVFDGNFIQLMSANTARCHSP